MRYKNVALVEYVLFEVRVGLHQAYHSYDLIRAYPPCAFLSWPL